MAASCGAALLMSTTRVATWWALETAAAAGTKLEPGADLLMLWWRGGRANAQVVCASAPAAAQAHSTPAADEPRRRPGPAMISLSGQLLAAPVLVLVSEWMLMWVCSEREWWCGVCVGCVVGCAKEKEVDLSTSCEVKPKRGERGHLKKRRQQTGDDLAPNLAARW
jgi:hypothetical protein